MLADEVTGPARPVGVFADRPPADPAAQRPIAFPSAPSHGPHGLLAFYPDSESVPGTTVTIWLKKNIVLHWNRDVLIERLRQEFYERELPEETTTVLEQQREARDEGQQLLDPGFEIGRFIVWPLYPVENSPVDSAASLVIDDSFRRRVDAP